MKRVAYIENDKYGGYFSSWCAEIARGLRSMGYEIRRFRASKLDTLPLTRSTIVRGSVRTTRRALDLVGVPQPKNVDIPKCLRGEEFTGRKVWETTLGSLRRAKKKVFVKSLEQQKAWKGETVNFANEYSGDATFLYPDNYKVLASEIISLFEETRFYVLNGKLLNCNTRRPLPEALVLALKIIKNYKNAPVSYCIDVGKIYGNPSFDPWTLYDYSLTDEENREKLKKIPSRWVIIELNEGFSAANISCVNTKDYARMTAARWYEMVGMKKVAKKIASEATTALPL